MKINKAYFIFLLLTFSSIIDCNNRVLRKNYSNKLKVSNPQETNFKNKLQNLKKMMMDEVVRQKDFVNDLTVFKKECDSDKLCKGKILTDLQAQEMISDHQNLLLLNKFYDIITKNLKNGKYDDTIEIVNEYFPFINFYDAEFNAIQQTEKDKNRVDIKEFILRDVLTEINKQITEILNNESKDEKELIKLRKNVLNLGFKKKDDFYLKFDSEVSTTILQIREHFPGFIQEKLILKDFSQFEKYRTEMLNKIFKEEYKINDWNLEKIRLNLEIKTKIYKYRLLTGVEKQQLVKQYEDFIEQVDEFMKIKENNKDCQSRMTSFSYGLNDFYEKAAQVDLTEIDYENSFNLLKILSDQVSHIKCDRKAVDSSMAEAKETYNTILARFQEQTNKQKYQELNQSKKKFYQKFFLYNEVVKSELNNETELKYIDYAIMMNLPPKFCYKKPDAGYIPKKCPEGYERKGIFCIKSCDVIANKKSQTCKNWKFWGIGCTCNDTLQDNLKKSFFINYFSDDVLTNFNKGVECDNKKDWKHLALCYKTNCPNFLPGYVNCGMGACAITDNVCKWEVTSMIYDTISNLINIILFSLTLGTSSLAQWFAEGIIGNFTSKDMISYSKSLIGGILKILRISLEKDKDTQNTIENGMKEGNSWIGSIWKDTDKRQRVIEKATNTLTSIIFKNLSDDNKKSLAKAVEQRFETLGTQQYSFWESIKKAGKDYFKDCKDLNGDAGKDIGENEMKALMKDNCVQKLVSIISMVDRTGLVGLYVTFNRPTCPDQSNDYKAISDKERFIPKKIPPKILKNFEDDEEFEKNNKMF